MGLQSRKIRFDDEQFNHYFLCRYIPKSAGSDRMSQSLLSFKEGHPPHRKAWTDCATSELKRVQELSGACVIRALHHDEQQIQGHIQHSLDHLGVKVSHAISGSYQPDCVFKTKDVPKLTQLNKTERKMVLDKAYKFTIPDRRPQRILIIDDIFTTGATTLSILSAVLRAAPSSDVSIFTLASTDYNASLNDSVKLKGSYEWQPNDGWMRVAEDASGYTEALSKLKTFIMNGSFE